MPQGCPVLLDGNEVLSEFNAAAGGKSKAAAIGGSSGTSDSFSETALT